MPRPVYLTATQRIFEPDLHERHITAPGEAVVATYSPEYDKSGALQLVQDGEHNLYEEIQSHRDSTDLSLILNRYFNGDPTALSRVQGTYMDVTGLPDNIHEAMTLVDNARRDFDTLPPDIKQLFDNDANQFLSSLGTEDWFEKMQLKQDSSEKIVENGEKISVSTEVSEVKE